MTTKEPLRVGIVGCGEVAVVRYGHIPSLLKIEDARIAAVCDKNEDLARGMAKRFHINRYYADLSEMLEKEGLDMVDICTPPNIHATLSIQAIEAGCHVLVEKPMAFSVKEADEMMAASKRNHVKLCVVHNKLFEPVLMKARAMVNEGSIGDLVGIDIKDLSEAVALIANKDHWCHKLPGGILGEALPHPIYLAVAFLGNLEPVAVHTRKFSSYDWVVADEIRMILEGEKGVGAITFSCNSPKKDKVIIDIFGTERNLRIDLFNSVMTSYGVGGSSRPSRGLENLSQTFQLLTSTASAVVNVISGRFHCGHRTLIQRFIESIQNDTEPPVTMEEGREVVRVLEKITAQI